MPAAAGSRPRPRNLGKARDVKGRIDNIGDFYVFNSRAKVGGTAGWAIPTTTDTAVCATQAAGGTNSTLVMSLGPLKVGSRIKGGYLIGQIESTTGDGTQISWDLRKLTAVAADPSDASVDAMDAPLDVEVDTAMGSANTSLPAIDELVVAGVSYYALITSTTASSNDVQLLGVVLKIVDEPVAY